MGPVCPHNQTLNTLLSQDSLLLPAAFTAIFISAMRLLHTSDWHLGQHFMGKSRQAEHQALIDWLLQQVQAEAVDAVLLAGDIFDTGTPPSHARELYSQLVVRLREAGVGLLLLGGNHDSVAMLGENQALLACLGTHLVAQPAVQPSDQVLVLPQRDGAPGCIVCAVPFLRPRDVLQSQAGQSALDKQQALQQAIQAHYAAVYQAALVRQAELQARLGRRLPLVATGHLTTLGSSLSESVREIYVGSLEAFPCDAFPPVDYIALGHIHRPQRVGGHEHIRYCGSPLPLSFDEAAQDKEVLLIDLGDTGLQKVRPLPVPRFQGLQAVRGTLDELALAMPALAAQASAACPMWLEVTVSQDDYLPDLPARVQQMTEGLPLEVLRVRRDRGTATAQLAALARETLDELSPQEVFERRLQQEALAPELALALAERYRGVLEALQQGEGEAEGAAA